MNDWEHIRICTVKLPILGYCENNSYPTAVNEQAVSQGLFVTYNLLE